MRYSLVIIGFILCISLLFLGLFNYRDLSITTNEIVIVDDSAEVFKLIEKNTPIRVEINNDRWGQAILEDPEVLFQVWKVIRESKSYPSRYIPNQDRISGYIYFRDGSEEYFSISDRFQLGEYFLESEEGEIEVGKLYRIFRHTLETKTNLLKMVEKASEIYLYHAEYAFDPDSEKMLRIAGEARIGLLSCLTLSEKVEESDELNVLLLENGYQPLFHLILCLKESEGKDMPIVLSVLSPDYFTLMDMGFLNQNVVYFEGALFDYCCKMLTPSFERK